jgi:hypothetical protein
VPREFGEPATTAGSPLAFFSGLAAASLAVRIALAETPPPAKTARNARHSSSEKTR